MSNNKRSAALLYRPAYAPPAPAPPAPAPQKKPRQLQDKAARDEARRQREHKEKEEREARAVQLKARDELRMQLEGPHVYSEATQAHYIGRWKLSYHWPYDRLSWEKPGSRQSRKEQSSLLITQAAAFPGDGPHKLRGFVDLELTEDVEYDGWQYNDMLMEARVMPGKGYLEMSLMSRVHAPWGNGEKWYSGAGSMVILSSSIDTTGGGPLRGVGVVRLRHTHSDPRYLTFEATKCCDDPSWADDPMDRDEAKARARLLDYRPVAQILGPDSDSDDGEEGEKDSTGSS